MLDDAQRWHYWPHCVPMVGINNDWPVSRYPELAGRSPASFWRWEQITDFDQLAAYPGSYLWVADGFDTIDPDGQPKTPTGDVYTLIAHLRAMQARGVFLQAGHAHIEHAETLRAAGFDVQCWASCSQIDPFALRQALSEIRPSRFVAQIEGPAERDAMAAAIYAGVFGALPWDCVIAGWGDFQAL